MFKKAQDVQISLKMLVYGSYGTGKTPLALQFPKPVMLDLERGSLFYGKCYDFDVAHVDSFDQCYQAISFLAKNKRKHETIIIDSLSHAWDLCQDKWLNIFGNGNKKDLLRISKNNWGPVKADWRHFMDLIKNLNMHVICTAREKN